MSSPSPSSPSLSLPFSSLSPPTPSLYHTTFLTPLLSSPAAFLSSLPSHLLISLKLNDVERFVHLCRQLSQCFQLKFENILLDSKRIQMIYIVEEALFGKSSEGFQKATETETETKSEQGDKGNDSEVNLSALISNYKFVKSSLTMDPHHISTLISTLSLLLQKRNIHHSSPSPTPLSLSLNPFLYYYFTISHHDFSYDIDENSRLLGSESISSLMKTDRHCHSLIQTARRYFGGKSLGQGRGQIFQHFLMETLVIPYLHDTYTTAYHKALYFLELFYPTHHADSKEHFKILYLHLFSAPHSLFQSIDKSLQSSILFYKLLSRIIRHGVSTLFSTITMDDINVFLNVWIQSLELEINNISSPIKNREWQINDQILLNNQVNRVDTISTHVSIVIVYTMHMTFQGNGSGSDPVGSAFRSILHSLSTFFHPSNNGKFTSPLSTFLKDFVFYYSQRRAIENGGKAKYDKKYFIPPSYDIETFRFILPLTINSLFSKSIFMSTAAAFSLRLMGHLRPTLVMSHFAPHLHSALVDPSQSSRMLNLLGSLSWLADPLFNRESHPQGVQHLQAAMMESLPGIDPTDPMKTTITLTWLTMLFYMIPMRDASSQSQSKGQGVSPSPLLYGKFCVDNAVNPIPPAGSEEGNTRSFDPDDIGASSNSNSGSGDSSPDGSLIVDSEFVGDCEDDSRILTFHFKDFSVEFLKGIISVLDSADKFSKKDYLDGQMIRILWKSTRAFFSALSGEIYDLTTNLLIGNSMESVRPHAAKQFGVLFYTAALTRPHVFLPNLMEKIKKKFSSSSLPPSNELEWILYLTSQAIKQGGGSADKGHSSHHALIPHLDFLESMYYKTFNHADLSVRKASNKLLRNLLRGLTLVYPNDYRNFCGKIIGEERDKGSPHCKHWNTWGRFRPHWTHESDYDDSLLEVDGIHWHLPSDEEMRFAKDIGERALRIPLSLLVEYSKGKDIFAFCTPFGEQKIPTNSDNLSTSTAENSNGNETKISSTPQDNMTNQSARDTKEGFLSTNIARVLNVVRGLSFVLGKMDGEGEGERQGQGHTESEEEEKGKGDGDEESDSVGQGKVDEVRSPELKLKFTNPIPSIQMDFVSSLLSSPSPPISLRSSLLRLLHPFCEFSLPSVSVDKISVSSLSLNSLELLTKLYSHLLLHFGSDSNRSESEKSQSQASKSYWICYQKEHKINIRPMLIQYFYDIHQCRISQFSFGNSFTSDVRNAIGNLHKLSVFDFVKIRDKARIVMVETCRRYPKAIGIVNSLTVKTLRENTPKDNKGSDPSPSSSHSPSSSPSSSTDEMVQGALSIFRSSRVSKWSQRNIFRQKKTLFSVLETVEKYHEDKIQMGAQSVFTALFSEVTLMGLKKDKVDVESVMKSMSVNANTNSNDLDSSLYSKYFTRDFLLLRNISIDSENDRRVFCYNSLMTFLLKRCLSSEIHWRYRLMSAAFLYVLMNPKIFIKLTPTSDSDSDSSPSSTSSFCSYHEVVLFFVRSLNSDLSPLRTMAFAAVNRIFGSHEKSILTMKRKAENPTLSTPDFSSPLCSLSPSSSLIRSSLPLCCVSIDTVEQFLSTTFYDSLDSGSGITVEMDKEKKSNDKNLSFSSPSFYTKVVMDRVETFLYHSSPPSFTVNLDFSFPPLPPVTLNSVKEILFSPSFISSLIGNLVHHHPSLQRSASGESNENAERGSRGAGDTIAAMANHFLPESSFPSTRYALTNDLEFIHTDLIRGMATIFPQVVEENSILFKEIHSLTQNITENDQQCTAAEVICGLILSVRHSSPLAQNSLWKILLPLIQFGLVNCPSESIPQWSDMIRRITAECDPKRYFHLTKLILDITFQCFPGEMTKDNGKGESVTATSSPSAIQKRLRYLQSLLMECGYRSSSLCDFILSQFTSKEMLNNPYKQVREAVGSILSIVMRNQSVIVDTHQGQGVKGKGKRVTVEIGNHKSTWDFLVLIEKKLREGIPLMYGKNNAESGDNGNGTENTLDVLSPSAMSEETSLRFLLETMLFMFSRLLHSGDQQWMSPILQLFFPHVILSQHHKHTETAATGKHVAMAFAFVQWKGPALLKGKDGNLSIGKEIQNHQKVIDGLIDSLKYLHTESFSPSLSSSSFSWHLRVEISSFLMIFIPRHAALLSDNHVQNIQNLLLEGTNCLLRDYQIEVREKAALAFSSLLSSILQQKRGGDTKKHFNAKFTPSNDILTIQKKLIKWCSGGGGGKDKEQKDSNSSVISTRHGGILGLSAMIQSFPYDLPSNIPQLLTFLAHFVTSPPPLSTQIKILFSDFMRTHKDEWEITFKEQFTVEQLEQITAVNPAPSYFA